TSNATHDEPMIPMYIFYSMFGFQRTADGLWAAADQMARGFLLGATAGRTTLNGEGLQHEDGHSLLIAATNPAVVAYDPAFAYEIAHIMEQGLHRMYGDAQENVFYYLTVYNEPTVQPAEPADVDVEGLLKGIYRYSPAPQVDGPKANLLASGTGMQWALKAQQLLAQDWGVGASVWSVTSWTELRRDAVETEEYNLLNPGAEAKVPYIQQKLADADGPKVAVSDFMRAVPDLIARWVPGDYTSLGTDGFGMSDTRHALRRHFHVDAESIVVATLRQLARSGAVPATVPAEAAKKYAIDDVNAAPVGETGGDS
ncbi:transketolase-like TK C-terminal-containing protein, partial [Micromonospora parva]